MKKTFFIMLSSFLFIIRVLAQDSLYIYNTDGSVMSYQIAAVDSISFNMAHDSMYINKFGGAIVPYKISTVDSISYTKPGVLINGIRWATRNVATPGTFVSNPQDAGMFYQWNCRVGWPVTGAIGSIVATNGSSTWNSLWNGGNATPTAFDTWTSVNDPSPDGWRVPNTAEIQALMDSSKVTNTWLKQNGVFGTKFTDKISGNSIFLPGAGFRYENGGDLYDAGVYCYYWGNISRDFEKVNNIYYNSYYAYYNFYFRGNGYSVRSVAK